MLSTGSEQQGQTSISDPDQTLDLLVFFHQVCKKEVFLCAEQTKKYLFLMKSCSHGLPDMLTVYRNAPKFLDRQTFANSADPDQTAPKGAV